jgi:ribosomal protein L7Ae-like RNA K-turn-binding protein
VDTASRAKLLRLLGLGVRGRLAVVGVQQVRDAALRGKLALAVVAPDASVNSRNKVVPLLTARRIRFVEGPSAAELGAVIGKDSAAAIGVVDRNLARGIREIVDHGPVAARQEGV